MRHDHDSEPEGPWGLSDLEAQEVAAMYGVSGAVIGNRLHLVGRGYAVHREDVVREATAILRYTRDPSERRQLAALIAWASLVDSPLLRGAPFTDRG